MTGQYILDGHKPIPCEDLLEWGLWFETADRRVGLTIVGDKRVSTVFLGLDHNFSPGGPPLLFETMVFSDGDRSGDEQWRYSTWEEAYRMHQEIVEMLLAEFPGNPT